MFIDMSHLAELVDEVQKTKQSKTVGISRDVVAVLKPPGRKIVRSSRREPTTEDIAAFEAAASAWNDVDTDQFIKDVYESRRIAPRPPVEL